MTLYLLRHGIAVEPGSPGCPSDAERPLTTEGREKLREIAKAMDRLGVSFDLVLSSPLLRARQTAEAVIKTLKCRARLELTDGLMPQARPNKLMALLGRLAEENESILLVGHEPFLSSLISVLISGQTGCAVQMKKGGLCRLSIDSFRVGSTATLEWLLTPRQMCAIAET